MPRKKVENQSDCESTSVVTWDHPLVKAGFVPGYLLREAFGYSDGGWSLWVSNHLFLVKRMNREPWFNLARFIEWTAQPENAGDLPPVE
jgi:hypothetical protein